MNQHAPIRMTVEQFHDWLDARTARLTSDEPKWELFDGVAEMQESERWAHGRAKYHLMRAIERAIERSSVDLEAGIDSIGVAISGKAKYVPDVVVFPRGLIHDDDRVAPEPVIVVEVLSNSTRNKDLRVKAEGYGRVPTIQHYLVADPDTHEIFHYRRNGDDLVPPDAPVTSGIVRLDPPGIEIALAECFS
jgi:Uma2 family endonuclease